MGVGQFVLRHTKRTAIFTLVFGVFLQLYVPRMFARDSDKVCMPPNHALTGPEPSAPLPAAIHEAFERDGAVILRGVLSEEWVTRMHETVVDSFEHPTTWDKLYSTGLAAFFCAQKTVLLPQTSLCGRSMARYSPLASLAADLTRSKTVRVAEPSEAIGSARARSGDCGHTAWHRDDSYFPIRGPEPSNPKSPRAVVRFWIPLETINPDQHTMEFVAGSHLTRHQDKLSGTNFAETARTNRSSLRLLKWEAHKGDVIAFAGETVHNAATKNCTSCLRLILGFAGESAFFDNTVPSPLMPLGGGQTHKAPLRGVEFPKVLDTRPGQAHHVPEEWIEGGGLRPTAWGVVSSMLDSMQQGFGGFQGIWFTGCWSEEGLGGWIARTFYDSPRLCMKTADQPEADFWRYVIRVYSRAPLLAGNWVHSFNQ